MLNYMWPIHEPHNWDSHLLRLFDAQTTRFKINISHSFVLKHKETGELSYYHASANNHSVYEQPILISSKVDFLSFLDSLRNEDVLESVQKQRPNSKYTVVAVPSTSFYLYHLHDFPIGCPSKTLPPFLKKNMYIHTLQHSRGKTKRPYNDNLCFFRCLALHRGHSINALETPTKALFEKWRVALMRSGHSSPFEGVSLTQLDQLEAFFKLNIDVFEFQNLDKSPVLVPVRRSSYQRDDTLRLLMHEQHFMYILNIDKRGHALACQKCHKLWRLENQLNNHQKTCTGLGTRMHYKGGVYTTPISPLEELRRYGIDVDTTYVYPYRATYDFEVYFDKNNLPPSSSNTSYTAKHIPLSVSIASNVPGFEQAHCIVTEGDSKKLVGDMLRYLVKISDESYTLLEDKFSHVFADIEARRSKILSEHGEDPLATKDIDELENRFRRYLHQLPVVGFNSGKYDLNVIKPFLFPQLSAGLGDKGIEIVEAGEEVGQRAGASKSELFVVKRNNDYLCISTGKLKFLDLKNFIPPGYSYSFYLRAMEISEKKSFFPYEYIDSLERLGETTLPTQDKFYSSLKDSNISDEDYELCQKLWTDKNMKTVRDFLIYYNNCDVGPFLAALDKQVSIYEKLGVDLLKDGLSVPGITLKYLFNSVPRGVIFSLFHHDESELHQLLREQMTGGLSIIFHRYHEKGKTFVRGCKDKVVKGVQGMDANALYLWALMQEMPTEYPVIRRVEDGFKRKCRGVFGRKAREWLEYTAESEGIRIQHQHNGKEKVIRVAKDKCYRVDGYDAVNKTVYEFHGCLFHGHDCRKTKGKTSHPYNNKSLEELRAETEEKVRRLRENGKVRVVEMWECEWSKKRVEPEIRAVIKRLLPPPRPLRYSESAMHDEEGILRGIQRGAVFGLVKCDLQVPIELHDHFSEFQPIIKNTNISKDDIGEHMQAYAEEHKLLQQPRKTLVGSYFGKQLLVATPLLVWYLNHGILVSNITLVLEYTPDACFRQFGLDVSQARRSGDVDPTKKMIGEMFKLLGNSGYGRTLTNRGKHRDVHYVSSKEGSKLVNDVRFRKMVEIENDLVEVEMAKKHVLWDLPLQIGFFVYQYAKLRMLQFHYDFIDRFVDRSDYQLLEMDTDSLYIAFSQPSLEEAVRPEMRREFYEEYSQWLPACACTLHTQQFIDTRSKGQPFDVTCDTCDKQRAFDKRTPGLFKTEYSGDGFIGLCSKTYYCFGEVEGDKVSSKGLNKHQNSLNATTYQNVLSQKRSGGGENRGFRTDGKTMHTYKQHRDALSYFYIKRVVGSDGVSTSPTLV